MKTALRLLVRDTMTTRAMSAPNIHAPAHAANEHAASTRAAARQADRIDRVRRAPTLIGKVWLIVLMADAPLAMREVHNALCTVIDDPMDPNALSGRLAEAVHSGYLMQSGQRQSMRYRVTHNCTIPPSIRVRDVLDLVQA